MSYSYDRRHLNEVHRLTDGLFYFLSPGRDHTEIEEELHENANIDYDRVAIVCRPPFDNLTTFFLSTLS